jgi:hypothetical protein
MESVKRDPRGQGDAGEFSAALWFRSRGAAVFIPFFHTPRDFDFIAAWGDEVKRVQVKTSSVFQNGRWDVSVCTRGGNRSWDGLVKHLDPTRYDCLFVVVGDGRQWLIPATEVEAKTRILLGGPKYSEYEIEPGPPLRSQAASLDSAPAWRDSRAVKGDAL